MIKSSGFNVFPAEVEQVLCAHPEVAEAYVLGMAEDGRGERVKAYVVPIDPAAATPELVTRLMQHCRARLSQWSCPREIEFRRELPKTGVGKVDERALVGGTAARGPIP
jgi:long-chain acyl-CoA synthetase